VGNTESRQDNGREPGDMGEEASQGGCGDDAADGAGEDMADSHRIDRSAPAEGREHDRQAGSAGEELGDTGCERQEKRQVEAGGSEQSDQDMADSGFIGSDRRPDGSCGWSRESGEAGVNATGCGGQSNGMRQAEPPLGGDVDGPTSGMDYAQLQVACDNRTDELRLLGNGVVPATAERAFRILMQELDIDHPVS